MRYTDRQVVDYDLENRLNEVNITPSERAYALAAAERAEFLVTTVQRIAAAFRRLTETTALKPSVRT